MNTLKALIFDLDGTVADTEDIHRRAFNAAFHETGLSWYWSRKLYTELLGISGGRERLVSYAKSREDFKQPADLDGFARSLHRLKTEHYGRLLNETTTPLRTGVLRLLNEARLAGLRIGIATATAEVNVYRLLNKNLPAGWTNWFQAIVSSDQIPQKKPSPAVYLRTLELLGVEADDAIALEDTVNGNRAAIAAGMKTVVTTHRFTRQGDFTGAGLVVSHLGEPDKPFQLFRGSAQGARYVDLSLLRRLLNHTPIADTISRPLYQAMVH
jgi:HAD superfamily hydrolase (TIGR01509 family)